MSPEEERYRYLKLKQMEAEAAPEQEQPGVFARAGNAIAGAADSLRRPDTVPGAMLQHFGASASQGAMPQLAGVVEAGNELGRRGRAAMGFSILEGDDVPDSDPSVPLGTALMRAYRGERDTAKRNLKKADETNPWPSLVADVGGALTMPIPGPKKAATAAKLLSRVMKYGAQGLGIGVVNGVNRSDADLTKGEVVQLAKDARDSGTTTALLSSILGPAIERGTARLTRSLEDGAADKAFRAFNGSARITDKARGMGYEAPEELRDLGRYALDKKLIPWSGSAEEVASRSDALNRSSGKGIGQATDIFDARGQALPLADGGGVILGQPFNFKKASGAARDGIGKTNTLEDRAIGPANNLISDIADQGKKASDVGSGTAARQLKTQAQDAVDWKAEPALARQLYRKGAQGFTNGEGGFLSQMSKSLTPEEMATLKTNNINFGKTADISEFAGDTASRQAQGKYKNVISALIMGSAAAPGVATGSLPATVGGMGLVGLVKLLNNPGLMSRTSDTAAKAISGRGGSFADAATKLTAAEVKGLVDYLRKKDDKKP